MNSFFLIAHAVTISTAIPGSYANSTSSSPGAFVANFYQFALLIGGILAFGAIVFGGIKYVASAGNPSAQSDGKEWIWGALIGLLLLAGAYLILKVINPQLLNLNPATLNGIAVATTPTPPISTPTPSQPSTGACPIPALLTLTDPQSISMEGGQTIQWTSSDPAVQANLTALHAAYTQFQTALGSAGDTYSLGSVYRPLQYQQLFYALYQDAKTYQVYGCQAGGGGGSCPAANTTYTSNTSCASVISAIQAEENKHGVCKTTSPCVVGTPGTCGVPHTAGIGIDITLSGPVTLSGVNAFLTSKGIPLKWQALSTDPVHFNLQSPPSGTCPS